MKKARMIVVLALVLALFPGCAHMQGGEVGESTAPALDRILAKGELVVGTSADQPPLTAKTKEGKIIGLDADLSRIMAGAMGVKLRLEAMPFPELLPALEAGKVDLILSGMTITPKRNLKVAFVGPYYASGKGIVTKMRTIASLEDAADMNKPEFTLAALKDSTSQMFAEKLISRAELVTTETLDEALDLLFADKVDALIADYPFCAVAAYRYQEKGLVAGQARFTYEPLGIALPANDPLLVNWVDNFLKALKNSGDLKRLTDRWFKDASWMKELL